MRVGSPSPRIRGRGDLAGTKQAGEKDFIVADLYRDEAILKEAFALVEADRRLQRPQNGATREAPLARWKGQLSLAQVG